MTREMPDDLLLWREADDGMNARGANSGFFARHWTAPFRYHWRPSLLEDAPGAAVSPSTVTAALEELGKSREALEAERQAHEQARSEAREAQALAGERGKRIAALEAERDRECEGRG